MKCGVVGAKEVYHRCVAGGVVGFKPAHRGVCPKCARTLGAAQLAGQQALERHGAGPGAVGALGGGQAGAVASAQGAAPPRQRRRRAAEEVQRDLTGTGEREAAAEETGEGEAEEVPVGGSVPRVLQRVDTRRVAQGLEMEVAREQVLELFKRPQPRLRWIPRGARVAAARVFAAALGRVADNPREEKAWLVLLALARVIFADSAQVGEAAEDVLAGGERAAARLRAALEEPWRRRAPRTPWRALPSSWRKGVSWTL